MAALWAVSMAGWKADVKVASLVDLWEPLMVDLSVEQLAAWKAWS